MQTSWMNGRSGLNLFLAGFFTPLGLGAVLAVVGFGLTGSGYLVLAGLASALFLVVTANFLYAGQRNTERIVWGVAAVLLVLAVTAILLGQSPAAYHIAVQLLMPVVFAVVLTVPNVRAFLAVQRGEVLEPPAEVESLLLAGPDGKSVIPA